MSKLICGIDPGINGAIVFLEDGKYYDRHVMPRIGKFLDIDGLLEILRLHDVSHCYIEDVHAIFQASAAATFSFGFTCGAIRAAVTACAIPYTMVQPKKWQSLVYQGVPEIRKPGKEGKKGKIDTKAMSLLATKRLFPGQLLCNSGDSKKEHDGIIDALLIAYYGSKQ